MMRAEVEVTCNQNEMLRAGSYRLLSSLGETGSRKLGKPPSPARQQSLTLLGQVGSHVGRCSGNRQGAEPPRGCRAFGTHEKAHPVGLREGWGSVIHLPISCGERSSQPLSLWYHSCAGKSFKLPPLFWVSAD